MNELDLEQYLHQLRDKQRQAEREAREAAERGEAPEIGYLVFALGGEEFAVPLAKVRSVQSLPELTSVPFVPAYYRGVLNLRGQIVSVIDLRAKMKLEPIDTSETSVVILENGSKRMGVVVDSINRVLTVKNEAEIRPVTPLDADHLLDGEKI